MRDFFKSCKRKGLLIELGGEAILVIRRLTTGNRGCRRASHRNTKTYQPLPTIRPEPLGRLCRINNNSCTSTVEFLGTVIREVPPRTTPIQFLRELEKRLRVKHPDEGDERNRESTGRVQLAETLGTAGVRSPQVSVLWGTVKHIRQGSRGISLLHSSGRSKVPSDVQQAVSRSGTHARKLSLYTPAGRKAAGEGGGLGSIYQQRIPHTNGGAYQKDTPKASGSRCRDNLYQVRTIVDHQIRWSAIFTPAHKHKSSARNIIPKYSKDSNRVNQEGGKTLAEFPNSIELGKLGSGQDPNNKEHSTTSLV
ncbi:UNVERIFIED_CONTAM: hypothetical protein Scaly_3027500 [Sesamum calycinum]|uniref:Ribosomal protein S3 n=1 Tax=Sesamum calycinum TaxID=2727403 RepID=A0AAW2K7R9_9LAMI